MWSNSQLQSISACRGKSACAACFPYGVLIRSVFQVRGEKNPKKPNWIFQRAPITKSHKADVVMRGTCFCAGTHSRAVKGGTLEGYRGEKKWCTFHLCYGSDFYSACPLCWERPTRGSFYSHDGSFASIVCFPLQIAALQVGCLF